MHKGTLWLVFLCALPMVGVAQGPLIDESPSSMPSGHPPVANNNGAGQLANLMRPPDMGTGEAAPDLPTGTVEVLVVDSADVPVNGATLDVGVMAADGARNRIPGQTNAEGRYRFEGLATGEAQAYRVNLSFRGARYGSRPFRLPAENGYRVRLRQVPVTDDQRGVFQMLGQTIVEVQQNRLHVIQQASLTNAGRSTYVFPEEGMELALPEGYLAFQYQRVMTDQRVTEDAEAGVARLQGSLPPGTVELAWAYDLPIDDERMDVSVDVPFRTFRYAVIAPESEDIRLSVREMPVPQLVDNEGQRFWMTRLQRQPTDPPLGTVRMTISGLPRPGPGRWIATALAGLFVCFGLLGFWGGPRQHKKQEDLGVAQVRDRRRALVEEMKALEEDFRDGEIGSEFRQSRRDEIVRALAGVLLDEKLARESIGIATDVPSDPQSANPTKS